jgi:hypothetical protein
MKPDPMLESVLDADPLTAYCSMACNPNHRPHKTIVTKPCTADVQERHDGLNKGPRYNKL